MAVALSFIDHDLTKADRDAKELPETSPDADDETAQAEMD
jgi:hypothetical protein